MKPSRLIRIEAAVIGALVLLGVGQALFSLTQLIP